MPVNFEMNVIYQHLISVRHFTDKRSLTFTPVLDTRNSRLEKTVN